MMKKCCVCDQVKMFSAFYKRKGSPDGYRNDCKDCRKERSIRNHFAKHEVSKQKMKDRYKKRIENDPDWHVDWYAANRDKSLLDSKQNYIRHRQARIRAVVEWARSNKGKANANKKAYKAGKANACPIWVKNNADYMWMMQETYSLANLRTTLFGFQWHVDHIVPLRGKIVSGLHVPWNLQVIPGSENCIKSNKFVGV